MTLPDFIIIGAPKSGTTAMKTNFNRHHPRIWLGGKEINFFNNHWAKGLDWYEAKFPANTRKNTCYGEKTPSYIYSLERAGVVSSRRYCHRRMHEIVPDAKLILCLRNPVDRAYSHWHMEHTNKAGYSETFEEAYLKDMRNMKDESYVRFTDNDFVQKGFYIEYIENLLQYYPREQLHICITEELKKDVERQYNQIYEFLEVGIPDDVDYAVSQTQYESPISPELSEALRAVFAPYNERLFELLGREIDTWN